MASSASVHSSAAFSVTAKSKTTAVLLAVFLSGWSWLYTYMVNKKKFWTFIGGIVVIVISDVLAYRGAHTVQNCDSFGFCTQQLVGVKSGFIILSLLVAVVIWVWAIVDNATKSQSWYDGFPNG
jgi:hypothetical protein